MSVRYRYDSTVEGFAMPLRIWINGKPHWLNDASDVWHSMKLPENKKAANIKVDPDFYAASFDLGVNQLED